MTAGSEHDDCEGVTDGHYRDESGTAQSCPLYSTSASRVGDGAKVCECRDGHTDEAGGAHQLSSLLGTAHEASGCNYCRVADGYSTAEARAANSATAGPLSEEDAAAGVRCGTCAIGYYGEYDKANNRPPCKKCVCDNGEANSGASCAENKQCVACDDEAGYVLRETYLYGQLQQTYCDTKQCVCGESIDGALFTAGVATVGTECAVDGTPGLGADVCVSCSGTWTETVDGKQQSGSYVNADGGGGGCKRLVETEEDVVVVVTPEPPAPAPA